VTASVNELPVSGNVNVVGTLVVGAGVRGGVTTTVGGGTGGCATPTVEVVGTVDGGGVVDVVLEGGTVTCVVVGVTVVGVTHGATVSAYTWVPLGDDTTMRHDCGADRSGEAMVNRTGAPNVSLSTVRTVCPLRVTVTVVSASVRGMSNTTPSQSNSGSTKLADAVPG
jgi:hypothetical protein